MANLIGANKMLFGIFMDSPIATDSARYIISIIPFIGADILLRNAN